MITLFLGFLWMIMMVFTCFVFRIPMDKITKQSNGSGDSTYYYIQLLSLVFLTPIITLVWSVFEWRKPNYSKLLRWLIVVLRYVLGYFMVVYGASKILHSQFPELSLYRLTEPLGEFSPMGLAWTFMGYSTAFNIFTGVAEFAGGFLLLFRRTKVLGALLSMTVLCNVVVMNFCFDIPVKIFSTHLFLMAVMIIVPDLKRLLGFFFLNRDIAPPEPYPIIEKDWKWPRIIFKSIAVVLVMMPFLMVVARKRTLYDRLGPSMAGIYIVQEFRRNNIVVPPLTTDTMRWSQLLLDKNGKGTVITMSEKRMYMQAKIDTLKCTMILCNRDDNAWQQMHYILRNDKQLVLYGKIDEDSVRISFSRKSVDSLPLVNRGFHWINEYPYNR